ncbi:uncharacterized protein LOC144345461, partial [Saccoglossus kowalevskii]
YIELELSQRQKEVKAAVNIKEIFKQQSSVVYIEELERAERDRKDELKHAAVVMQRSSRRQLARKEAIKLRQDFNTKLWEREYIASKAQRERERYEKIAEAMKQQAMQNKLAVMRLNRIGPHVDIWE